MTQNRVNTLGILLLDSKRWDEAAAQFRKAEELDAVKGVCRANLGLALLEAGKADDALPMLQEAGRLQGRIPAIDALLTLHCCHALTERVRPTSGRFGPCALTRMVINSP